MTVYLPKQTDLAGTLAYTTRAADGTETEHTQPLAELAQTKAENGGTLVTLPETAPIVGDTRGCIAESRSTNLHDANP